MTDEPLTCPICGRRRREDRPLCNTHMRRVGQTMIDRYFARRGHHKHAAMTGGADAITATAAAVRAVEAEIEASAREYDRIRALGIRPRWIPERNRWVDPREHALDVLTGYHRRHQFGLDESNDRNVLERVVAELFPTEKAATHAKR